MIKKITYLIFLLLSGQLLYAQSDKISGTVKDQSGQPLIGATISILGGHAVTKTNVDGKFNLEVPGNNKTIHITYIGFKPTDYNLQSGQRSVTITLEDQGTNLSDVVVVGYGTSLKRNLLGAVGTVNGDEIAERKTTQISQALQGAIAGVTVTRSTSEPGAGATISVRGITSLGNNGALVIIDGAPGSLDDVNPDDVASISVLKDAASASIYGSRAAAGVILVTTKRAKAGQSEFSYSSDFGFQTLAATPQFADAVTYMRLYNELKVNDGATPIYPQSTIDNYATLHAQNPVKYSDTKWLDLFYKSPAFQQRHNLGITVGNDVVRTKISLGYIDQAGLEPNNKYNKINFRANNDININSKLNANIDIAYIRSNPTGPNYDENYDAKAFNPLYPAYYPDGNYAYGKDGVNPIARNQLGGFANSRAQSISGKFQLNYSPVKGLKLTGIFAPKLTFGNSSSFKRIVPIGAENDISTIAYRDGTINALSQGQSFSQALNMQFLANYTTTIAKDHNITALLGFEENDAYAENNTEYRDGFILTDFTVLDAGAVTNATNGGSASESALRSYFTRVGYNYKNKYYLEGIIRYDGSSRFAPDHRFGLFPSVSTSWVISEEPFMHNSPFSFLKLRADYGQVGNQDIGNYAYQSSVTLGTALLYNNGVVTAYPTGAQNAAAIQNISWETTATSDIGLDFGFFKNKLTATLDAFYKNTTGILLALPVPATLGLNAPNQNAGAMKNYGWEAELAWKDHIGKDFSYNISANISNYNNKVTDLRGINTLGSKAILEGYEYNTWYGYKSAGYFQNAADVASSPKLTGKEAPGDIKYQDLNHDRKIDGNDKVPLASSLPHYSYGGVINMKYKSFDMGLQFQGIGKRTGMLSGLVVEPFLANFGNVPIGLVGNYWTPNNLNAKYPRLTYANENVNYVASSFWLNDASYFRLKSVTVGYNLPINWVKHVGMKSARIYIAANDLFSLSHYPKGWDPEGAQDFPATQTTYPITTTYFAGLNLIF